MKQNHDDSYVDHFEHERIFDLLKRKYFWNNMNKNVKKYVDICLICHWIRLVRHKSHDMLQSLFIFEKSRQDWTMNFIIDLSFSKHKKIVYDSMLMMIDRYIKINLYISSKKTWNAENLTNALIDEIFIKFEKLVFIITNRDFFLFSNFDRRFIIICEYVYDITLFIIHKSTNKSKNKIKFLNHICEVMLIINKMIKSNDSTLLNTLTITVSRDVITHNIEDCESRLLMIKRSQR